VELTRRSVLMGSGALLLAGCADGQAGRQAGPSPATSATTTGPNIVRQRTGNVVLPAHVESLTQQLNDAWATGDPDRVMSLVRGTGRGRRTAARALELRMRNFERLGMVEGRWYAGLPTERTRNASGGAVRYQADLVFAHQVEGCDPRPVVETSPAEFRKTSPDAPLELLQLGTPSSQFSPSFWDVAEIDVIATEHAWVAYRLADAGAARRLAPAIERGAARALATVPGHEGMSKIFYALTWPEVDGRLYGGVAVGDADAHAYYHPFLDPETLAAGQEKPAVEGDAPRATGRAGLHRSSWSRPDFEDVACHEAVHILANQWHSDLAFTPTWVVEGYAGWATDGGERLMATGGGLIRSHFPQFLRIATGSHADFHEVPSSVRLANYRCAAAVFACVEATRGAEAAHRVAQAFYTDPQRTQKLIGTTQDRLLADTQKWLGA